MRYAVKNKLQKAVMKYLDLHERRIIPESEIGKFKQHIIDALKTIISQYPHCKSFKPNFYGIGKDSSDYYLEFDGQQIMDFRLLKGLE